MIKTSTHVTLTWEKEGKEVSREFKIRPPKCGNTEEAIDVFNLPQDSEIMDTLLDGSGVDTIDLAKKILGRKYALKIVERGLHLVVEGDLSDINYDTLDLVGVKWALVNFTLALFSKSAEQMLLLKTLHENPPVSQVT